MLPIARLRKSWVAATKQRSGNLGSEIGRNERAMRSALDNNLKHIIRWRPLRFGPFLYGRTFHRDPVPAGVICEKVGHLNCAATSF